MADGDNTEVEEDVDEVNDDVEDVEDDSGVGEENVRDNGPWDVSDNGDTGDIKDCGPSSGGIGSGSKILAKSLFESFGGK